MTEQQMLELYPELKLLPRGDFKAELWRELRRIKPMIASTHRREGFGTVTPYAVVPDVPQMVEFLTKAFDAVVSHQSTGSEGGLHTEMRLNESMLMMGRVMEKWPAMPVALHYFVENVDAAYERAIAAGATVLMGDMGKPAARSYGEYSAFIEDPAGNYWYLASRIENSEPVKQPLVAYLHPRSASQMIDFMAAVFGATEQGRYADGGRIMHASVMVGDSIVEMGEGAESKPQSLYLYVDDPDAVYKRAMTAGAKSLFEVTDQAYGERTGGFTDPQGNQWFVSRYLDR